MPGSTSSVADVPSRGVSRRALLRATGIGAAGLAASPWLKACRRRSRKRPRLPRLATAAWDDLASRLSGRLLRPGDAMYPAATVINATRYMGCGPAGIAVCVSPEDAAACVTWARETGVPFAVRSGGHSYAGFSTSDGLVIDVKGMRTVSVDPAAGTVTVAGGASNADVGDALKPYGVYFPGGRCPTVGVSGLTLGGGWGFSCRHLGMTCDSLLATEVVTASGEIVTASATEHPDLFWAVRGAGWRQLRRAHLVHLQGGADARRHGLQSLVVGWGYRGAGRCHHADAGCMVRASSVSASTVRSPIAAAALPAGSARSRHGRALLGTAGRRGGVAGPGRADPGRGRANRRAGKSFWAAREFLSATTPLGTYADQDRVRSRADAAAGITTMLEWIAHDAGRSVSGAGEHRRSSMAGAARSMTWPRTPPRSSTATPTSSSNAR